MGIRAFLWRGGAFLGLLTGVAGCEDRLRPTFGGPGTGDGPSSVVTAPAELDTVFRGVTFDLGVRIEDDHGVDSFWIAPSEPLMDTLSFSGGEETIVLGLIPLTVPGPSTTDTLMINVYGVDLIGDTGVVYTRRLIVQ